MGGDQPITDAHVRTILESTAGIAWSSEGGRLTYVSPNVLDLLGVTPAQVLDGETGWRELVCAEDHARLEAAAVAARDVGVGEAVIRVRGRDGQLRQMRHRLRATLDPEGGPTRIHGITWDVSEHAAELARSNAELESFATAVSHDLQAPLRVVRGFAEALQERGLDPEARRFVDAIARSGARMHQMVTELLDYARVGQGGSTDVTDAEAALRRALDNLQLDVRASGATITYDALPRVRAPWQRLTQVFQNLVDNAIRFRTPSVPPVVRVAADTSGEMTRFSVTDNGIGIEPRHLGHLFDLFTRVRTDLEPSGVGMGLALCKRIVEHHGGSIWVQSTPHEGSTFRFTLQSGDT